MWRDAFKLKAMNNPLSATQGRHNNQQATDNVFNGFAQYLMTRPSRFWSLRLYVCLDIIVTCIIGVVSAVSLNRVAFTGLAGSFGWVITGAVFAAAVCGLLDVLINSLAPDRFGIPLVRRHRWAIFMAIALGMAAFIYVNLKNPTLYALLMRYALNCAGCVVIVALDFMERGQGELGDSAIEQARPH